MSHQLPFGPADILLPISDLSRWACIACDQFTSQPEYWEKALEFADDAPSALHVTLPEVYLESEDKDARIAAINAKMEEYLSAGLFAEFKNSLVLTERTLSNGKIRRGIVGAFDLEEYSYEPGAKCRIRPTEGTVLSRIPPRVEIRRGAALELPHIMVLVDDAGRSVIESIDTSELVPLYDVELMLGGGRIKGWLLPEKNKRELLAALTELAAELENGGDSLLFAVGDGNHSLAAAKAAAPVIGGDKARYALAELVSIHSEAVDFEPIYRVLFGADAADVTKALKAAFPGKKGKKVSYISARGEGEIFVDGLEAELLQNFIDEYIAAHPSVSVDYIHGEDALRSLAAGEGAVGFLFGGIEKTELFSYVREKGIFPRKTFSIGEAVDKRYYMEARRIR